MAKQDKDIEFIPTDEVDETEAADIEAGALNLEDRGEMVEAETGGAEDEAVHASDVGQPRGLMTVEAEDFEADKLDEDEAEELELEADEEAAEAGERAEVEEEHEEDLEEILCRHYGIGAVEPAEEVTRGEERRRPRLGEFVCQSCFTRRPVSQLADPTRHLCVDCTANAA